MSYLKGKHVLLNGGDMEETRLGGMTVNGKTVQIDRSTHRHNDTTTDQQIDR
jgi:hypothetical protein